MDNKFTRLCQIFGQERAPQVTLKGILCKRKKINVCILKNKKLNTVSSYSVDGTSEKHGSCLEDMGSCKQNINNQLKSTLAKKIRSTFSLHHYISATQSIRLPHNHSLGRGEWITATSITLPQKDQRSTIWNEMGIKQGLNTMDTIQSKYRNFMF